MASKSSKSPIAMDCKRILDEPEVHVIRVPFLYLGLEYTNCYVVRDKGETLVIDPGVASPMASRAFSRIAKEIGATLQNRIR